MCMCASKMCGSICASFGQVETVNRLDFIHQILKCAPQAAKRGLSNLIQPPGNLEGSKSDTEMQFLVHVRRGLVV